MRGALSRNSVQGAPVRIIPADAGSTQVAQYKDVADRDHPRGCGEHAVVTTINALGVGSSPRMRGARYDSIRWRDRLGIIPADAGST